ncbi:MAG: undecaprenyldiphospho-muramoylpentapeptide beta-N-acetylglucosaminyltransferase [Spirochaetes bacterium GWD1_27_9]|nr:MAG: undecaprenyldiphospho-muramoylpentapeptide beta-N-acetylglucosaminyltransferase [Spirochaetes bacterium GWB1_27_13]OHD24795.1 MAG: undecaprenyldiphospho-muramoylpentapeptide beta-N-acetylglucosaminyltransferase [Spirochaetes bacterium GWC1_27_15]OHD45201.1 MAG: undecaprenyldiphospho-muramoylpentapeptide beta-N-acetylglucosaminyltransferase [Spirochaetes bacterium GWD1_27_9]
MKEIRVLFTGGGSGGHTMPAISMIQALKKYCLQNNTKCEILYVGSHNGIEKEIATKNEIDFVSISTGKLRRYFSFKNFSDIFRILKGFFDSLKIIKKFSPQLIFSTGGFVSVPPVVAGKMKKIPVIIHEQTVDAGLANKIAAKFATKICLTFPESKKYFPQSKTLITGIPLRDEIFEGNVEVAKKRFNFDFNQPVILFMGGGLGCHILNEIGLQIIPNLLDKANIIFQTGKANDGKDFVEMQKLYESLTPDKKNKFALFEFVNEEIGDIYKITDLAIARSGAGTVNEFLALGLPSIFIPLAIATNNEQLKNAMIMQKINAAFIIEENNLTKESLLKTIDEILFTDKIKTMKKNLSNYENVFGKNNLLNLIVDILNKKII